MALKRVNLNLDEKLVERVDAYADKMFVNRTNAFALIIGQFFEQKDTMTTVSALAKMLEMQEQGGAELP